MNEDNEEHNLFIVNESNAKVTFCISRTARSFSKTIQPNEKYLHREKKMFKFNFFANFDDEREKKEFPGPLECVTHKLIRITTSLECIEENLAGYPQEKQICLRKMHLRNKLASTSGKVNLYDILGLDMTEIRKLSIGDQKIAINKAFRDQMKIWHPDKNFGDDEIARQIIVAKETLLDDERRACYHNEADYDKGWFSLERYKAIFWPDCYTEEQNRAYWCRIAFMAAWFGIAVGGAVVTALTGGTTASAVLMCGLLFAEVLSGITEERSDDFLEYKTIDFHGKGREGDEGIAEEPQKATFSYESKGAWISKMIVTYLLNGKQIKKEVSGSGRIVEIPLAARQVKVRFQVRRPAWGDIMKYDRFKKQWCKPYKPHVFCYEKPPLARTFTISGNLWWEAVMRVSDEYHEETREMVGDISLANVNSAGKYLNFMSDLFFPYVSMVR